MAKAKTNTAVGLIRVALCAGACFLIVGLTMAFGFTTAHGSDADTQTIGISGNLSTRDASSTVAADQKLAVSSSSSSSSSSNSSAATVSDAATASSRTLAKADTRTITVKDPDPVIEITSYDADNEDTVALAATVGEINPLPTAPRITPDTSADGWQVGSVSGYDVASSSTHTASGRLLDDNCVTVAVPQSQSYMLGRAVEIVYDGKVVVATVTDTGGFEGYGRSLDLAGGVWKAFGASSCADWGVRQVSYRFL